MLVCMCWCVCAHGICGAYADKYVVCACAYAQVRRVVLDPTSIQHCGSTHYM